MSVGGPSRPLQWTIHPWVHNSCNQLSAEDQLRGVQVPDVHPAALVPGECQGQLHSHPPAWGAPPPPPPPPPPRLPARPPACLPSCWGLAQTRCMQASHCDASTAQHALARALPSQCVAPGLLSMSAGDFAEVYRQPEYAGMAPLLPLLICAQLL